MLIRISVPLISLVSHVALGQPPGEDAAADGTGTKTVWHEAKALVPTLVIPPKDFDPERSYTLIVALHGYGSSAEAFSRVGRKLANAGFLVALPEAPYALVIDGKMGYDWFLYQKGDDALQLKAAMLGIHHHLSAVVTDLRRRYRIRGTHVLGFSQGAMMAIVAGIYHNGLFDGIVTFGLPAFDTAWFQNDTLNAGSHVPVLLVHGKHDERAKIRVSEQARDRLRENGYKVILRSFDGGHTVPDDQLDVVETWLREGRRRNAGQ